MEKINALKMINIEAGKMTNRECMIAGGVTMAGLSLMWTGVGAAFAVRGFFSAFNGGCFKS